VLAVGVPERDYAVAVCQPARSEVDLSYAALVGLLEDIGLEPVDTLTAVPSGSSSTCPLSRCPAGDWPS
jgi:hypothetical protein